MPGRAMRTTAENSVPSASRQLCSGFDSAASRTGTTSVPADGRARDLVVVVGLLGEQLGDRVDPGHGPGLERLDPSVDGWSRRSTSSCSGRVRRRSPRRARSRRPRRRGWSRSAAELLLVVSELVGATEAERVGVQLDRRTVRTERRARPWLPASMTPGMPRSGSRVVEAPLGVGDRLLEALQVGGRNVPCSKVATAMGRRSSGPALGR